MLKVLYNVVHGCTIYIIDYATLCTEWAKMNSISLYFNIHIGWTRWSYRCHVLLAICNGHIWLASVCLWESSDRLLQTLLQVTVSKTQYTYCVQLLHKKHIILLIKYVHMIILILYTSVYNIRILSNVYPNVSSSTPHWWAPRSVNQLSVSFAIFVCDD